MAITGRIVILTRHDPRQPATSPPQHSVPSAADASRSRYRVTGWRPDSNC
jgi:hypothetical protein